MKKTKKLLSVLLAVLMVLSSMTVIASAYGDYNNLGAEVYDSIDAPRGALLTVEQRASWVMDTLDGLLASLHLGKGNYLIARYDLNSFDGICDTFNQTMFNTLKAVLGDLSDLEAGAIRNKIDSRSKNGDTACVMALVQLLGDNKALVSKVLEKGSLNLGSIVGGMVDLSGVNKILADLPSFLGETIYGLSMRQLTNGIGDDPAWPNSKPWAELEVKPSFEEMIKNLILKLLTEPRHTTSITSPEQNTLGSQALTEVGDDGVTYYYCYGLDKDGNLKTTYEGEEPNRIYLSHWDENSALLKDFDASIIDFSGKSVYEILEKVLPWAFDTFAAHNLDAQFRATLMQAAGAVNVAENDPEIQATLKAKIDEYKAVQDDGDVWALSNKFEAEDGAAGDYNFMYFSLSGKNINEKPDDLYYVVEWGGSYEYYHVDFSGVNPFFALGNWEYQIGTWAEVLTDYTPGTSVLAHLNDILGNILKTAVPTADWTMGDNSNLVNNIVKIIKQFLRAYPEVVFADGKLPENFDSMTAEEGVVLAGKMLMPSLLKAIILPDDVTSVEELIVYGVREYTDTVLQEYGAAWDAKIAEAAAKSGAEKEDAFLDIALNMAASLGAYYLRDFLGYGTYRTSDLTNNTTLTTEVRGIKMGPSYSWREIMGDMVDWVINLWAPRLTSNIQSKYPNAFSGNDGLAKLSAVFSTLFPSTARIIGCNSDTYALDLDVVYSKLRAGLNGDFTPLLTALERKADGTTANGSIAKAIVTIVKELFGGLGFDSANSWTATYTANSKSYVGLSAFLDSAANSDTPITALLGNYGDRKPLANLAGTIVGCIGETRNIWVHDALAVVLHMVLMGDLSYDGVWYDGLDALTGADSFTVEFTIGLDTNGLPAAFNNGNYRSGSTTQDGNYSSTVTRVEILDATGKQISGSAKELNTTLQPNTKASFSTQLNNVSSDVTTDTIVVYYTVKTPSGDMMNDGKELTLRKNVIVTSEKNDSLTATETTATDNINFSGNYTDGTKSASCSYDLQYSARYGYTNTYISDAESLSAVSNTTLSLVDNSVETVSHLDAVHTYSKIYIADYGYNVVDEDTGKITVRTGEDASSDLVDLTSKLTVLKNGQALSNDELQNLWFKWSLNNGGGIQASGDVNGEPFNASAASIWTTDTSAVRGDFEDDFTTYQITVNPVLEYNYNETGVRLGSRQQETKTKTQSAQFTTYINLYNGYGIDDVLGAALDAAYTRDQFVSGSAADAAWNAYQAALTYAMNQRYGKWVASSFAEDHTQDGVSTFKIAAENLQEAIDELQHYIIEVEEEEVVIIEPSNPESDLYFAYTALQNEFDKGYRDINFALYRWYKYKDPRNAISNLLDACTPPSGVANDYLVGVDLDNDGIAGVVAAVDDAKISELVNELVVKPTEEQQKAAADARTNFAMPEYDVQQVSNWVTSMQTNEGRLLAKYSVAELATLHHYLNDSIAKYGNEVASEYTPESFAEYTARLNHAKDVDKDKAAQPSVLHAARYDFQVAYKALIKTDDAVDLEALKAIMATAREILANIDDYKLSAKGEENFDSLEEALKDLILKAGYVVEYEEETYYIGGEYTGEYALSQEGLLSGAKKQNWVNEITDRVTDAVGNFTSALAKDPEIFGREEHHDNPDVPYDGSEDHNGVVDTERNGDITDGYLYGITVGQDILQVFHASTKLELEANDLGMTNGTGATVKLLRANGEVFKVYTVIIFGDVDGDADITAIDANNVIVAAGGSSTLEGAYKFAADVDGDDDITAMDANAIIVGAGGGAAVTTNPYA